MHMTLRYVTTLLFTAFAAGSALAQDKYPSKPVTVIVPQAPGGAHDTIARVVAQKVTEQTGQQFIVEPITSVATAGYVLVANNNFPAHNVAEQFAAIIKDDLPKWAKIVKDSGATVD